MPNNLLTISCGAAPNIVYCRDPYNIFQLSKPTPSSLLSNCVLFRLCRCKKYIKYKIHLAGPRGLVTSLTKEEMATV